MGKDEIKMFWISWFDGTVQVGQGYPMEGVLTQLKIQTPFSVRGIAFSSEATVPAEWIFSQALGKFWNTDMRMYTVQYESYFFNEDTMGILPTLTLHRQV